MTGPSLSDIFDLTSPDFDSVTPSVWGPAGEALVSAADVHVGDNVLDICCGTGASALTAARAVGSAGHVTGVDFASRLVEVSRRNALDQGLGNVEFVVGDVTRLAAHDHADFDALLCGFGVFFLPGMDDTVRDLLTLLRPGGRVAFGAWHDDALYDFMGAFYKEVARVKGEDLPPVSPGELPDGSLHPITRIDTPEKITAWLESVGAVNASASVLTLRVPRTDEFSWTMVVGSGLRASLRGLDDASIADVRTGFLRRLADEGMAEVKCDTVIGVAERR